MHFTRPDFHRRLSVVLYLAVAPIGLAPATPPTGSHPDVHAAAIAKQPLADRLGCTHVNSTYHFTDKDFLNEGVDRIYELGMRTIKLYLHQPRTFYKFNNDWPKTFPNLVEIARHPYYRNVFDNESRVRNERPTNQQVRGFYLIEPDGTQASAWEFFESLLNRKSH